MISPLQGKIIIACPLKIKMSNDLIDTFLRIFLFCYGVLGVNGTM